MRRQRRFGDIDCMQQTFPGDVIRAPRAEDILAVLRNSQATPDELEEALAGIDAAMTEAESEVEQLETRRNQMLVLGRVTHPDMDDLEKQILVANRIVLALSIARDDLPSRISSRRSSDKAIVERTTKVIKLRNDAIAALVELHHHAEKIAALLVTVRNTDEEFRALNLNRSEIGLRSELRPIDILARHLGCGVSDLPDVREWQLDGYTSRKRKHLLDRARELLDKSAAKAA